MEVNQDNKLIRDTNEWKRGLVEKERTLVEQLRVAETKYGNAKDEAKLKKEQYEASHAKATAAEKAYQATLEKLKRTKASIAEADRIITDEQSTLSEGHHIATVQRSTENELNTAQPSVATAMDELARMKVKGKLSQKALDSKSKPGQWKTGYLADHLEHTPLEDFVGLWGVIDRASAELLDPDPASQLILVLSEANCLNNSVVKSNVKNFPELQTHFRDDRPAEANRDLNSLTSQEFFARHEEHGLRLKTKGKWVQQVGRLADILYGKDTK